MKRKTKNFSWRNKRDENIYEPIDYPIYIFSEGTKTEPLYFAAIKKIIEDNPIYKNLIHIEPCGGDTVGIVQTAKQYIQRNGITEGQIWCVYDKDDFPPEKFNEAQFLCDKLCSESQKIQYHAAWSNECIEFWFVLHFANYTSNNHRKQYIEFLTEKFKNFGIGEYHKNLTDIFSILIEYGDPKLAIRYARQIQKENKGKKPSDIAPGTRVFELVNELAKYLPKEIREKII